MFSHRILMAGIASLCIGLCAPAFAASPIGADAKPAEAAPAAKVQPVSLSSDTKVNPSKVHRKKRVVRTGQYNIDPKFRAQEVSFSGYKPGTIVIDTGKRFLYLVQPGGTAKRYGVGVGKQGFGWKGSQRISRKAEWPTWTPPSQMIKRQPELAKYSAANGGMPPGLMNPLGARAMYLFQNGKDTLYRLHGSPEWWSIGKAVSSGCVRLMNQDIIDLYNRVPVKTPVLVT